MEELRRQRDMAQSQVDELRKKLQEDQQVFLSLLCVLGSLPFSWSIGITHSFLYDNDSGFKPGRITLPICEEMSLLL